MLNSHGLVPYESLIVSGRHSTNLLHVPSPRPTSRVWAVSPVSAPETSTVATASAAAVEAWDVRPFGRYLEKDEGLGYQRYEQNAP